MDDSGNSIRKSENMSVVVVAIVSSAFMICFALIACRVARVCFDLLKKYTRRNDDSQYVVDLPMSYDEELSLPRRTYPRRGQHARYTDRSRPAHASRNLNAPSRARESRRSNQDERQKATTPGCQNFYVGDDSTPSSSPATSNLTSPEYQRRTGNHNHPQIVPRFDKWREHLPQNRELSPEPRMHRSPQRERSAEQRMHRTPPWERSAEQRMHRTPPRERSAEQRMHRSPQRERSAEQRMHRTPQRERSAEQRMHQPPPRERSAEQRMHRSPQRERSAEQRMHQPPPRERSAEQRMHQPPPRERSAEQRMHRTPPRERSAEQRMHRTPQRSRQRSIEPTQFTESTACPLLAKASKGGSFMDDLQFPGQRRSKSLCPAMWGKSMGCYDLFNYSRI